MTLRLARKLALIGIAIGAADALLWWAVYIFNPFHLPTVGNIPPNYREPFLDLVISDSPFVLCPGSLLMFFTIDIGGWVAWFMWILAVLLNGPIYYGIGLLIEVLPEGKRRVPTRARRPAGKLDS